MFFNHMDPASVFACCTLPVSKDGLPNYGSELKPTPYGYGPGHPHIGYEPLRTIHARIDRTKQDRSTPEDETGMLEDEREDGRMKDMLKLIYISESFLL